MRGKARKAQKIKSSSFPSPFFSSVLSFLERIPPRPALSLTEGQREGVDEATPAEKINPYKRATLPLLLRSDSVAITRLCSFLYKKTIGQKLPFASHLIAVVKPNTGLNPLPCQPLPFVRLSIAWIHFFALQWKQCKHCKTNGLLRRPTLYLLVLALASFSK